MKELELLKNPIFWLGMALILVWLAIWQLPDNRLHLVFCDVGQGDAVLVSHLSRQILIDGGPNDKVLECLAANLPFWDRTIEMVVLTHPEADHSTGLVDVVERYDIKQFVVNSIVNDSSSFWEFYQAVLAEGAEIYSPQAGDRIRLGPVEFLVLWPEEKLGDGRIWCGGNNEECEATNFSLMSAREDKKIAPRQARGTSAQIRSKLLPRTPIEIEKNNLAPNVLGAVLYPGEINETSIVLQLSFGKFDALFTGDIGFDTEKRINWPDPPALAAGRQAGGRQIEVLKVAHHGSKYSTGEEFLEKIRPLLAVISVGKNSWGHPTKEVIKKFRDLEVEMLRTDQEGEIEIVSDGRKWGLK